MMSTASEQPKKKRRVDLKKNVESNPSPSQLPLVRPNQIPKSSKDPNRGMYPRIRNKRSAACASFTKASQLLKESSEKKDEPIKNGISDVSNPSVSSDDANVPSTSQSSEYPKKKKNKFAHQTSCYRSASNAKQKIRNRSSVSKSSHKISHYFKPIFRYSNKKTIKKSTNTSVFDGSPPVDCTSNDCYSLPLDGNNIHLSVPDLIYNDFESSNDIPGPSGYVFPQKRSDKEIAETPDRETVFQTTLKETKHLLNDTDTSDSDDGIAQPNYFETLPPHIIELILCQIPFVDLMRNARVCKTWCDIINAENFIEWKKIYYRLKKDSDKGPLHMEWICSQLSIDAAENCFGGLIKFFYQYYKKMPSINMYDLLMTIPKAVDAEKVISERFPEFLKKESKAWCIFATVILLSETVKDVYHFYQSLMTANSDCNRHDITDAMYCVASFLFHFKITFGINYGLHYRVYSALYWMENESFTKEGEGSQTLKVVKGLPGQQSIHSYGVNSKLHLTNEQLRILNHKLQPGNILKINALAGTGKTTTIIHLAQLYPQMKFLNIMFNKAVCEEAKKRFPLNVTCKTAHSIAYAQWGFRLKHKLSSKLRPHDLVPDLEYYAGLSVPIHTHAKYVLSTVEAFIQSDDSKFLIDHVPNNFGQSLQAIANHRSLILKDADQIWQKMIDKDNKSQRITHDVYLKLYQLSKPKIIGYDCIMVDEAQDSNPAMLDIVMSQRLPVILVGDPNQQIYGFRGAKNALQNIRSTHTYCLTKSFRFGPEIAYIASCCLEVLNSSIFTTLVGSKQPSCIDGKLIGQYAIIARTNVQLFNEAFRLCVQKRFKSFEPQIIHGCFAGGIASYGFDQIIEISNMANYPEKEPPKVRDKFLSKFRSYKALTSYARSVEDHDLLTKIELVNQHGSQIIKYIEIIKEKCSHNIDLANVVFTTAHKSKGLEFDTVCLTNDFFISIDIDFLNRPRHKCEENSIMYVAVTRAKKSLILSDQLLKACLGAQEKFEYPVRTTQVKTKENPLRCVSCSTEFNPHTALTLVRRELILANGNIIEGGPLCIRCASKTHFRPRHDMEALVMYLDPLPDYAHRSMAALVGPLPTDPPLDQDTESFNENGQVFHINVFF